jgi:subtilase family serine protease
MFMQKIIIGALLACSISAIYADELYPAKDGSGTFIVPTSSIRPSQTDAGHPNAYDSDGLPGHCETPASLACVYQLTPRVPGCPLRATTINPSGGAGTTIGVVEEGDNEFQVSDLQTYSTKFNLPSPNITLYDAETCTPFVTAPSNIGQAAQDEHVLDIEMIHAMAPNASIVEVEAHTQTVGGDTFSTTAQMDKAAECASTLVKNAGGGFVSSSYGNQEYAAETQRDATYQTPGVVFVTSSGDYSAPATYPASSPYAVGAGATSILRDSNGNFIGEAAWSTNQQDEQLGQKSGTSGGPSVYESRPPFQIFIQTIVGAKRGTPDVAFDGDPATGVCVYSTYEKNTYGGNGWITDGGTSASAPAMAGIFDAAQQYGGIRVNSTTMTQNFLREIYYNSLKNYHAFWNDGISGNNGYPALQGYDFVTGLGSPRGYLGK